MYLRDLSAYASAAARMPRGLTQSDFNQTTHTPVEAYLDLLPRRQVVLGDLAKVNVEVGPRRPGTQRYFSALNVAILGWPWFSFERYFSLSRAEQQKRIVEVLHKALLQIAARTGSSRTWYDRAYAALVRRTFPLSEISEFELRCRFGLLSQREKRGLK